MNFPRILRRGAKTGVALSVLTSAAILLLSQQETGSAWSALNAVAHIIDGDDKEQPTAFSARESLLGLTVNAAAMGAWGVLYEGALDVLGQKPSFIAAAVGVTAAYVIDYKVVPKQYTPGIETRLSKTGVFLSYCALGAALTLSPLWNKE